MIAGGINSPAASSCGRLFDAVAAALSICFERQAYEGEAAMRLEAVVDLGSSGDATGYQFALECGVIDPRPLWEPLLSDLAAGVRPGVIAARFHKGLAQAVVEMATALRQAAGLDTVALSGGCFQNAILFAQIENGLRDRGLTVLSHSTVPAGDGGLSLGQAVIAAARLLSAPVEGAA
jgi:hydrogenase maturation protein HypF